MPTNTKPIHPGEILKEALETLEIPPVRLAAALGVAPNRIYQIVHGARVITADTSLRLAAFFGQRPGYWLELQKIYELAKAEEEFGEEIRKKVVPLEDVVEAREAAEALDAAMARCEAPVAWERVRQELRL